MVRLKYAPRRKYVHQVVRLDGEIFTAGRDYEVTELVAGKLIHQVGEDQVKVRSGSPVEYRPPTVEEKHAALRRAELGIFQ